MPIKTSGEELKKIRRRLRDANRRFVKLSRKEQRIALAKDVIAQLDAKRIKADSTYLRMPNLKKAAEKGLDFGECAAQAQCTVCGIGSLFISAVMKNDELPADKVAEAQEGCWDSPCMRDDVQVPYLEKWFDSEQLDLIEDYYERHIYDFESPIRQEYNNNKRLRMIMENIVSNGGRFDPYKGAHSKRNEAP